MVLLPDPRDFSDGGCSFRPCLQSAPWLKHHTHPLKPSLLSSKDKFKCILSIFKSTRLFPIIIIYFLLFMFSEEQKRSYAVVQMGFKVTLKPQMPQVCSPPPASASQALTTGARHHIWLTFTYIFVYCFIFLVFSSYVLPFIFISSVFATSLLIKHNFPHSNKNKPNRKYS